jgi:hypothetical protein
MVSPRFSIAPKLLALVKAIISAMAETARRLKVTSDVRMVTTKCSRGNLIDTFSSSACYSIDESRMLWGDGHSQRPRGVYIPAYLCSSVVFHISCSAFNLLVDRSESDQHLSVRRPQPQRFRPIQVAPKAISTMLPLPLSLVEALEQR